jgi:hypothetical protein
MKILTTLITILFISLLSSPLYSDEFTFHCTSVGMMSSSDLYKINTSEKSVVHTHSIIPPLWKDGKTEVFKENDKLNVYHWDDKNDTVWTISYEIEETGHTFMKMMLFNFKHQKLFTQMLRNDTSEDQNLVESQTLVKGYPSECYVIE